VQLLDHLLEAVEAAAVAAQLLGAQEVGAEHGEEHAPDPAGDQVRDLLAGQRLAGHAEVPQEHEQGADADQDPAQPGPHRGADPAPQLARIRFVVEVRVGLGLVGHGPSLVGHDLGPGSRGGTASRGVRHRASTARANAA
jgi:hypothetical protein